MRLRRKEIIERLLLVGLSICFNLVLFEVGYRVYHFSSIREDSSLAESLNAPEQNPALQSGAAKPPRVTLRNLIRPSSNEKIVYELKPNLSVQFQGELVTTNSYGMRGPEIAREKPPGVFRLLGIGDSILFGWGVKDSENYMQLLAQRLSSRISAQGQGVESLNLGVPGYNTTMEVASLEDKGLNFSPDAILLHFVNNDFDVPYFMLKPADPWTVKRSYFLEFIMGRLRNKALETEELVGMDMRGVERGDRSEVIQQYSSMVGAQGVSSALDRLAEISKERNVPVIIVYGTATAEQLSLLEQTAARHHFTLCAVKPFVDAYFEREGPTLTKEERGKRLRLRSGDPHPNPLGHKLYADAVEAALVKIFPQFQAQAQ